MLRFDLKVGQFTILKSNSRNARAESVKESCLSNFSPRHFRRVVQGVCMRLRQWWFVVVSLVVSMPLLAASDAEGKPVAVLFGQNLYAKDLAPPGGAKQNPDAASAERARGEMLRGRVWAAVFADYARERAIAPTEGEITSNVESQRRMMAQITTENNAKRAALIKELESPGLTEARRKAAQEYLDVLNRSAEFDAKRAQELSDPARQAMQQRSERLVAGQWVQAWKLNQTLYREFGGRIIFQQAGWEPIDAYRKLLDQYAAKKAFVIHDPALRAAVYSYFEHKFVYADEAKAKFYFEKPWWERTKEEMKAAGI
jgi:hypothetical protein